MSHDKRALQKQAQETFIYLAGNIRLGVKMSSSTTTRLEGREEENKKRLVEITQQVKYLLSLEDLPKNTANRSTKEANILTKLLDSISKEEKGNLGNKVPKRNEVV